MPVAETAVLLTAHRAGAGAPDSRDRASRASRPSSHTSASPMRRAPDHRRRDGPAPGLAGHARRQPLRLPRRDREQAFERPRRVDRARRAAAGRGCAGPPISSRIGVSAPPTAFADGASQTPRQRMFRTLKNEAVTKARAGAVVPRVGHCVRLGGSGRSRRCGEVPAVLDVVLHLCCQFTFTCSTAVALPAREEHRRQLLRLIADTAVRARCDRVAALREQRRGLIRSESHLSSCSLRAPLMAWPVEQSAAPRYDGAVMRSGPRQHVAR